MNMMAIHLNALVVKVREDRSVQNRVCYLALGVNCDREREVRAQGVP